MPVTPARPELDDISIRVFDRALHPELYPQSMSARLKSGDFSCVLSLGEAGHTILITLEGESVCETFLDASIELPRRGSILSFPLKTRREAALDVGGVFRWDTRIEIQSFDRDGYLAAHELWEADARRAYLSQEFDLGHRLIPPALSGMSLDFTHEYCLVQAWHTFPDNLAICRVHSRHERI